MTKNSLIKPRKLKGFRDYFPAQMKSRNHIVATLEAWAERACFEPIATPALEYCDTLLGSGGSETDKEVYRFTDHGDREVALRFDLTVPFARFVSEHQSELNMPFKKFQVGTVWRGEKPQKGRYREFVQADFDIIGVDSLEADAQILTVMAHGLSEVTGTPFTVGIGDRNLLGALIKHFFPDLTQDQPVLIAIDKLDKIGPDKVGELILAASGRDPAGLIQVLQSKTRTGGSDLEEVSRLIPETCHQHLNRYRSLLATLQTEEIPGCRFQPNIAIARGLGYYTGMVFETTLDHLPDFGSIASGGRYNQLVERFSKHPLEGVGGSVGVDRLVAGLEQIGIVGKAPTCDLVIALTSSEFLRQGHDLMNQCWRQGLKCEVCPKPGKLASQFKRADKMGARFVVVIGEDEISSGKYCLKDLTTGKQLGGFDLSQIPAYVANHATSVK